MKNIIQLLFLALLLVTVSCQEDQFETFETQINAKAELIQITNSHFNQINTSQDIKGNLKMGKGKGKGNGGSGGSTIYSMDLLPGDNGATSYTVSIASGETNGSGGLNGGWLEDEVPLINDPGCSFLPPSNPNFFTNSKWCGFSVSSKNNKVDKLIFWYRDILGKSNPLYSTQQFVLSDPQEEISSDFTVNINMEVPLYELKKWNGGNAIREVACINFGKLHFKEL